MGVYVIAEIGINHNGDIDLARRMIDAAKDCGADAVKFQLYEAEKVLQDMPELIPQVKHTELTEGSYYTIAEYANSVGIDCSASVFGADRLEWLVKTNPPWYKIASRSSAHNRAFTILVLNECADRMGKTVYVSLGMMNQVKWRTRIDLMHQYVNYPNAKFMYCKSQYPAEYSGDDMEEWFAMPLGGSLFGGKFIGFSDHAAGIEPSLWAIAQGATVIEKHFTLDRNMPGVDQKASIEPHELKLLCKLAPGIAAIAAL